MNGYMDLFLETGNPAFYMMAKQENGTANAAASCPAGGAPYRPANGPANRRGNLMAEEEASPR